MASTRPEGDISKSHPPKQSKQPGEESQMVPEPIVIRDDYLGSKKLLGKVALITGGDSGIGRSVAVHFAREGAHVAIAYLEEDDDAIETARRVELEGAESLLLKGNVQDREFCIAAVRNTLSRFGSIDILVNNAAEQHSKRNVEAITEQQLESTFKTNLFGYVFMVQAALEHMRSGSNIINTGSITGFRGSEHLLDYAATKGAIRAFTYSLANQVVDRGIRVNGVAPGPVWTPLIPATFSNEELAEFGLHTPMKRAAQPSEIGPAYVFLASKDASYMTGQFIHLNGGEFMA